MSQEKANINLTNWDIVGINPNDKNWTSGDIFLLLELIQMIKIGLVVIYFAFGQIIFKA